MASVRPPSGTRSRLFLHSGTKETFSGFHFALLYPGQWTVDISTSPEWRGGGPVMTPSEREKVEDDSPAGAAWLEVAADWTGLKMSCSRYSPHSPPSALHTRPYLTHNSALSVPRNGFQSGLASNAEDHFSNSTSHPVYPSYVRVV